MPKKKFIEWKEKESGCWECISHKGNHDGYPAMGHLGSSTLVYRHVYKECFGEVPKGMEIRHTCDNRKCINPEHLKIGTHKENIRDMMERNRQAKGEQKGSVKLTEEQVRKIRKDMRVQRTIAKDYGVGCTTIWSIKNNKKWRYLV